jgi:hypothetical protein
VGIREAAEAAEKAEAAAEKAEKTRIWTVNARRAEATVKDLLGLEGKCVLHYRDKEHDHGETGTVKLEDDLYVRIYTRPEYGPKPMWGGRPERIGSIPYLRLTNAQGDASFGMDFTTLGGLSKAIKEREEREAATARSMAEAAERKAAKEAALAARKGEK